MKKPLKLKDLVGQTRAKTVLDILCKSAKKRDVEIPHVLLSGPSGFGKTAHSLALANEIGTNFRLTNGGAIKNYKDLSRYVSLLNKKDILFIDEIHRLPISVCECLYTIMEDFRHDFITKEGVPVSEKVAPFTLIGATTDLGKMPKPLRGRFKFVAEFETYSIEELTQIVNLVSGTYGFKLNEKIAKCVAATCRGNPRDVVSRTEFVRDFMVANNVKKMSQAKLQDVIQLQGFDSRGLRKVDHDYIDILKEHGPIGLKNISSKLNLDMDTISEDIEPYLVQLNLINIGTKGREYV